MKVLGICRARLQPCRIFARLWLVACILQRIIYQQQATSNQQPVTSDKQPTTSDQQLLNSHLIFNLTNTILNLKQKIF